MTQGLSRRYGRSLPRQGRDYGTHSPAAFIDPYAPGSIDYEDRHREHVSEFPGGLVRIDYGAHADPNR